MRMHATAVRSQGVRHHGIISDAALGTQLYSQFDGILENVSQDMVYTTTTHEVVDSLLSGMNGTVFCYGQVRHGQHCTACWYLPKHSTPALASCCSSSCPSLCRVQTGAGKTFTMSGDLKHYQHRGLIPQAIHQVFREMDMRVDKMYKVHVSGFDAAQCSSDRL